MLVQDKEQPALWSNKDWKEDGPATFAVVIGVSRYDYLDGSQVSYGLDQLTVSALTAWKFFQWLSDEYRHPTRPLARCWLLLSPTPDEKKAYPAMAKAPLPTLQNCDDAIAGWYAAMQDLNSVYSQDSRAVFFFSGHGVEVTTERQILLPSDYLKPPLRAVNRALSTQNLSLGLRQLPMDEHIFCIDACRNDIKELRAKGLTGTPILNEAEASDTRPDLKAPVIYATGPGAAAWQPTSLEDGGSVFGSALVQGLKGEPDMKGEVDGDGTWITMRGLEDFLDPRVAAQLLKHASPVKQPVRIAGLPGKIRICEWPLPPGAKGAAGGPPGTGGEQPPRRGRTRGGRPRTGRLPMAPERAPVVPAPPPAPQMESLPLPPVWPAATPGQWNDQIYQVVGNEFMTALLNEVRTWDLRTGTWVPLGAPNGLKVSRIARDPDRRAYRIDVQSQIDSPFWFELNDPQVDVRAACVLPTDRATRPIYTLEVDLGQAEGRGAITDFDVVLAPSNWGVLGEAAQLWRQYRAVDIRDAADPQELKVLEAALRDKRESPLAATVAALLLLRAWRHDLLHDWARNLADWFADRPDGCVIWAEQLLRQARGEPRREALTWLLKLQQRGLPHLSESITLAARQVSELMRSLPPPEKQKSEEKEQYAALQQLQTRLEDALRTFRSGGVTATFMGAKTLITPEMLSVGEEAAVAGVGV